MSASVCEGVSASVCGFVGLRVVRFRFVGLCVCRLAGLSVESLWVVGMWVASLWVCGCVPLLRAKARVCA